jgi:hypothetical protein
MGKKSRPHLKNKTKTERAGVYGSMGRILA